MNRRFALPVVLLVALVSGCDEGDYEDAYASAPVVEQTDPQSQPTVEETGPVGSSDTAQTVEASDAVSPDDKAVMQKLRELRVIFSKSSDKARIHSIGFATLRDREKFEAALDAISSCPEIKSLDMKSSLVTDEDLKKIAKLTSAKSLNLSGTPITDEGIEFIGQMLSLETLYLTDTAISNASIPSVAMLKSLRILEISSDNITGGLEPIATLPQLNWLLLRDVTIKDGSLAKLAASPSLHRLTLTGSMIENQASLAKFKSSAPGVTIDE